MNVRMPDTMPKNVLRIQDDYLQSRAKEKGIVISLIAFEDSESEINILKNMVENSGGDIFRVNPEYILDEVNDFLENKAIASEVEIQMNLNKSMTFRDEEKKI